MYLKGQLLFPAHAGVIPSQMPGAPGARPVPRTRGGDPGGDLGGAGGDTCSPHTRG